MPNWLNEILYVLAMSKRTQYSIILGFIFFIGIHLLGWYMLENFELNGPAKSIQDFIVYKMSKKYDKVALIGLLVFWVFAYKCYQKDKNRFW